MWLDFKSDHRIIIESKQRSIPDIAQLREEGFFGHGDVDVV